MTLEAGLSGCLVLSSSDRDTIHTFTLYLLLRASIEQRMTILIYLLTLEFVCCQYTMYTNYFTLFIWDINWDINWDIMHARM